MTFEGLGRHLPSLCHSGLENGSWIFGRLRTNLHHPFLGFKSCWPDPGILYSIFDSTCPLSTNIFMEKKNFNQVGTGKNNWFQSKLKKRGQIRSKLKKTGQIRSKLKKNKSDLVETEKKTGQILSKLRKKTTKDYRIRNTADDQQNHF